MAIKSTSNTEHDWLRLTVVVAVLVGAFAVVFSPLVYKVLHPSEPLTQIVNLKPGIDMVGGTSLVYEIKAPEGAAHTGKLASAVKDVLERRVDPKGVKNLVWRPEGDTRLEIQMPLSPDAQGAAATRRSLRENMIHADDALKGTNVNPQAVLDAIEGRNGHTQAELPRLERGYASRVKLFETLKTEWNDIEAARKNLDVDKAAALLIKYPMLPPDNAPAEEKTKALARRKETLDAIDKTNLSHDRLDEILADSEPKAGLDALKAEVLKPAQDYNAAIASYLMAAQGMKTAAAALNQPDAPATQPTTQATTQASATQPAASGASASMTQPAGAALPATAPAIIYHPTPAEVLATQPLSAGIDKVLNSSDADKALAAIKQDPTLERKWFEIYAYAVAWKNAHKNLDIDPTTLSRIDQALAAPDGPKQIQAIEDEFTAAANSRVALIDSYAAAGAALAANKGAIDDSTDLKRLLKGAGVLEYHILVQPGTDMSQADYERYVKQLQEDGPRVHAGDEAKWFEEGEKADLAFVKPYNKKKYVLCYITPTPDGKLRSMDAHMPKEWHLTDASPERQPGGQMACAFRFDPQGADYFGQLTEANKGRPMAIVLDNTTISAPRIDAKITSSGIITGGGPGGFDNDELDYLVKTLKGGSLPATLSDEPISERTVGPQLGLDNLRAGLVACGLGLVVVAVFLCGYYFTAGIVATLAVLMNVLIVLAVMSAFNATFTLPSIAGIVLSVGTAVDANVLIFERLREEQHRGLSLRLALRNAYGKAFSAIIDSNMTTAITSIFLIQFGSEEVKGFGVTLIIGIVASLFTALFVTRTVFDILIDKFGVKHLGSLPLTFPKWDKLLKPDIDWMGKAWIFIAISIVGITVGLSLFFIKVNQGQMMGIEFASGTSVQFELARPMNQADLRTLVEKNADAATLPSPNVVTVGTSSTTYEIVTPSSDAVKVRDAVLKALVDKDGKTLLKVTVPSKFDFTGAPLAEVLKKNVIALEDKKTPAKSAWPAEYVPADVKDFEPGAAIVLNHIDPELTPLQISDRIRQAQLQLPAGDPAAGVVFSVEAPGNNAEAPTSVAVILCRNERLPYSADPAKWTDSLAAPLWKLTNESINRPAELQQVKNFDPQVARDAANRALMALTLSIAVIMAYIWFRFGNLKYGTATMVALIHDVLFTVAALGFAHYLYNVWGVGTILQLEPFRIDLTVVAGILTIMGYSMIDTIVVFDRIRENRGKFGAVNRKVINDAINQTLSRTLLTAGTNVITVAIMYFLGGPGIHGFTFVLLFGILVGTYSSVAIAAPILLLGRQEEAPAGVRGPLKAARVG